MLTHYPFRCNGIWIEADEHRVILAERLKALAEATAGEFLGQQLPVAWRWSYKAFWKPLKRDRDGSLLLIVTVFDSTRPSWRYERKLRLVRPKAISL